MKNLIILIETIALVAAVSFVQHLNTYNQDLMSQRNNIEGDLLIAKAQTTVCEKTIVEEKELNYKDLFDQCTQEKFLIGNQNVELRKMLDMTQTEPLIANDSK